MPIELRWAAIFLKDIFCRLKSTIIGASNAACSSDFTEFAFAPFRDAKSCSERRLGFAHPSLTPRAFAAFSAALVRSEIALPSCSATAVKHEVKSEVSRLHTLFCIFSGHIRMLPLYVY